MSITPPTIIPARSGEEAITIPEYLQNKTYPALTGLRGLAIVLVLLYHLGINHFLRQINGWLTGRTGVDIFFVLSGFLISTILIKEKIITNRISLKKFYTRRALRIIPVAYLFLLVMILLNNVFRLGITGNSFLTGFLLLKNMPIGNIHDYWTGHFWSLSVEEQFYLFFPLLIVWIDLDKLFVFTAAAIAVMLVFSLLGVHHIADSIPILHGFSHLSMYVFWEGPFAILIGCLFSILAFKGVIPGKCTRNNYLLSALLFVIAILIRAKTFYFYSEYLSEFISDILIGFVMMLSIKSANLFTRLLNSRFLLLMGTLSYSIYMWQQLFIWIPIRLTAPWGLSSDAWFVLTDIVRLAGILFTAAVSYYYFESKFLRLKTRFA